MTALLVRSKLHCCISTDCRASAKLKDLFAAASEAASEGIAEGTSTTSSSSSESTTTSEAASESSSANSSDASATTTTTATPAPIPTPKKDTYDLPITLHYSALPPLTSAEKTDSKTRLRGIDTAERNARLNAEARNVLEGYVYRIRDLLSGDSTSPFFQFSTDAERKKIEEKVEEVSNWMSDLGDGATTTELVERKRSLECVFFLSLLVEPN